MAIFASELALQSHSKSSKNHSYIVVQNEYPIYIGLLRNP